MRHFRNFSLTLVIAAAAMAAEPLEKTKTIDEQLKALDESPIAQEMRRLQKQAEEARAIVAKARQEAMAEQQKLMESEAWKKYTAERKALEAKRESSWSAERQEMAEAAQKLYSQRHAELRQFALGDAPLATKIGLDVLTYPRVSGSTSTQPLAVLLACRTLGVPYEWLYPQPSGFGAPRFDMPANAFVPWASAAPGTRRSEEIYYELALSASRMIAKPSSTDAAQARLAAMINSILASNSGTHESYAALIEGQVDLVLAVRAPSADELKLAEKKGVKLDHKPVAMDALVFMVNHKNPTKDLTRQELTAIYADALNKTPDEARVGRFTPYMRERNSGSRELFDQFLFDGKSPADLKEAERRSLYSFSMMGPYSQLTVDAGGLAYSVYYYERFMAMSPYTRNIAIDGVEPSAETIANGKYPFATPVYAVIRSGEPAESPASKLLNFLLSDEGQAVVRESGYVPVKRP